jgi:O-antigen biosynthesis protein
VGLTREQAVNANLAKQKFGEMTPSAMAKTDGAAGSDAETGSLFSPAQVIEIELNGPLPSVNSEGRGQRIWILARLHGDPIGTCVVHVSESVISEEQLAAILWTKFRDAISYRFLNAGLAEPRGLAASGIISGTSLRPDVSVPSQSVEPPISVVVCTRSRIKQLAECLRHIGELHYPSYEVIVVDNAPTSDEGRLLVESMPCSDRFRYVSEPRPGLSWARNTGVAAARNNVIAFLDDDDRPDRQWLKGLALGFARSGRVGCVTGLILPARLDTVAQEMFEQIGGHHKGLGFEHLIFSRYGPRNPLYPLPPFGTGANMAFLRETLEVIGGFDVALGAGTATAAGEDTLAMTLTLLADYDIAYEPTALMWHHHRRDLSELSRQLHGYSIGLAAFYAALLHRRPGVFIALLKLLPDVARYLRSTVVAGPGVVELMREPDGVADHLLAKVDRRHAWGLLKGPVAYMRSVHAQRRIDSSSSPPMRRP